MKKIIFGLLAILLIGGLIGFYQFNKKVEGLEDVEADFILTSDELFDAFEKDEPAAQANYVGKVVEVSGEVARINLTDSLQSIVLTAQNSMIGGVNCTFSQNIENIAVGDQVSVKCQCQGYLMDVVLNNCSLVRKND